MKGRTASRPYVCLDLGFHSDPKVMEVGNSAAGLFARALSYCGYHRTDGFVPKLWARANSTRGERQKLVDAGLWSVEERGYLVANWTRYQQTRAEVEAVTEARRRGAEITNEKRWGHRSSDRPSDNGSDRSTGRTEKEKETLKKTLTSSLTQEEDYELPTGEELQRLAAMNGLQVPGWALTEDEKDIPF